MCHVLFDLFFYVLLLHFDFIFAHFFYIVTIAICRAGTACSSNESPPFRDPFVVTIAFCCAGTARSSMAAHLSVTPVSLKQALRSGRRGRDLSPQSTYFLFERRKKPISIHVFSCYFICCLFTDFLVFIFIIVIVVFTKFLQLQ